MKLLSSFITIITSFRKHDAKSKLPKGREEKEWVRWVIGAVLVILLVPMFPRSRSLQFADMKEGSVSTRRIVAPFDFEILKTKEEVASDRKLAAQKVYPIFILDKDKINKINLQVDSFFEEIFNIRKILYNKIQLKSVFLDSLTKKYPIGTLDNTNWDMLINPRKRITRGDLHTFQNVLKKVIRDLLIVGILDIEKERIENPAHRLLIRDEEEIVSSFDDFYDLTEARAKAMEMFKNEYPENSKFILMGFGIFNFFLRPNLIYDDTTHKERMDDAKARVPLSRGFVFEEEKIVDRNERITPEIRKKLISLAIKMAEKGMQEGGMKRLLPTIGKAVFILIMLFILIIFIYLEQSEILKQNKSVFLLALIIFLVSLIAFLIRRLDGSEYLIPTAMGAMLLTTLFDTRIGYAGTAVISILIGGLWGNEFNLVVVSFFVGIVGVIIIKKIQDRSDLMQAILYVAGAYVFAITFMGLLRFLPFREIMKQWTYGAINGLFTPIITFGLLPLVESLFDITTDFSLLELSNLNHPLLKRLSVQAPGTYHHSILVGNLAESAAQSIGSNSLLARVGSYYHDVGKMEKSEYFAENQIGGENPHAKLTPRMSALILLNHVKRGLELAEKYRLPSSIKDIIGQHQGTSIMPFFYKKAIAKDGEDETNENDYRYPGPKPRTREAAIVMLADVVEATTRSLKDPTHSRLKGLIAEVVDERFQEGQLDEAPLTLRDLERIKEGFLTILAGTFHTRIEYPEKEDQKFQMKIVKK